MPFSIGTSALNDIGDLAAEIQRIERKISAES